MHGAGVLVTARHVVTCAHVLNRHAVGADSAPADAYIIDFPRASGGRSIRARVLPSGWFPQLDNLRRDVAILTFDDPLPDGVRPAILGNGLHSYRNPARVLGFPNGTSTGVWSHGTIDDTTGPEGEWVQLSGSLGRLDGRIEPGFSGGGVIDDTSGRVIGIIVATDISPDRLAAFMIPMEVIGDLWTPLRDLVGTDSILVDILDPPVLDEFAIELERLSWLESVPNRLRLVGLLPHIVPELLDGSMSVRTIVYACERRSHLRTLVDIVRYYQGPGGWLPTIDGLCERHRVAPTEGSLDSPSDWSDEQKAGLRAALEAMPDFQNARTRHHMINDFIAQVQKVLHRKIELRMSDDVAEDVAVLIEGCLAAPGALHLLIDTFAMRNWDRVEFVRLAGMARALDQHRLLTDAERSWLVTALAHVPGSWLTEAYRWAEPSPRTGELPPRRVAPLIRHVESYLYNRRHRLPPILTFVEHLAAKVTERGLSDGLRAWTDQVASRLHHSRAAVEALREQLEQLRTRPRDPVLTVRITPDAVESGRYVLAAVLRMDGRQRVIGVLDEPVDVPEIAGWLYNQLRAVYPLLNNETQDLVVEVVVPRALITEPIDQWSPTELALLGAPLGAKVAIVLRSYERPLYPDLGPPWLQKWRGAQQQTTASAGVMHFVPHGDNVTAAEIAGELSLERKLILVLGGPPEPRAKFEEPWDAYAAALATGVPYILWIREPDLGRAFHGRVTEALAGAPVRDLPRVIFSWRSDRQERDDLTKRLGRHATLFVCDETRPIEIDADLSPPRERT